MKKLVLIISVFWSANTIACGSASQNILRYWSLETIEEKEGFLKKQSCYQPMNYSPLRADPIIVKVVADAIGTGVKETTLRKIIDSFNCMYGAYYSKEYEDISQYIIENGMESMCNDSRLESSYVVIANGGVNLRSMPSKSGEKVGTVAEGVLVVVQRIEDGWAYVESYAGTGYIYLPLLKALKNS